MRLNGRELKQKARRTLWWCAVVLCISPLCGGWLVDRCPLHIRDPETGEALSLWNKVNPSPDILILGSSRLGTFVHTPELATMTARYATREPSLIFNAALSCGEPITLEFLTRHLLASKRQPPRLVLLETSPDLLARNNMLFKFIIMRQLVAADVPKYISDMMLSSAAISRLASSRLTPFFRHRSNLLNWAAETLSQTPAEKIRNVRTEKSTTVGWPLFQSLRDGKGKDAIPVLERMHRRTRRFGSLHDYELTGRTSASFEAILAMLSARGCAVVLVEPPFNSVQRAVLGEKVRRPFDKFLHRLRALYGCDFVDFSGRIPDGLFADEDHATNPGSVIFTDLLAKEVVAPAWSKLEKNIGN